MEVFRRDGVHSTGGRPGLGPDLVSLCLFNKIHKNSFLIHEADPNQLRDTVDDVPITGPKNQPNAVGPRASAGACVPHEGEAWHRRIMYSDYRPCGCAEYYIKLVHGRIIILNKLQR